MYTVVLFHYLSLFLKIVDTKIETFELEEMFNSQNEAAGSYRTADDLLDQRNPTYKEVDGVFNDPWGNLKVLICLQS